MHNPKKHIPSPLSLKTGGFGMLVREFPSPLELIPFNSSFLLFCWLLLCPFRELTVVIGIKKRLISSNKLIFGVTECKIPNSSPVKGEHVVSSFWVVLTEIFYSLLLSSWLLNQNFPGDLTDPLPSFCRLSWLCGIQQDRKTTIDLDRFLIQILMLYLCVFQLIVLIV